MKYERKNAKAYSRETMRGVWAAANVPFREDGAIDEDGYRRNMEHWISDLGIDGFFVAGKQGEFFSMSVDERKRMFDISVDAVGGRAQTIMSCSDQNMDVVIDLARHAQPAAPIILSCTRPFCTFPGAGRNAAALLRSHRLEGRYRHGSLVASRQRLSDEPRIVQPSGRYRNGRRNQIFGATRHVQAADRACRRPYPCLDRIGTGMAGEYP